MRAILGIRQLTVDSSETVQARIKTDPAFAEALLREATDMFFNGEAEAARLLLRDVVNATVVFELSRGVRDGNQSHSG